MKIFLIALFTLLVPAIKSQHDSVPAPAPLKVTAYIETYYSYDSGNPDNHLRPVFFYSFNRHNEFNLNLGFVQAAYSKDRVRANLALMAGTYAQYNLSAEHPVFQHVLESTVGVKLSEKNNLWLDAGIMPSHIGWESAIGANCWNLTRSLAAENSPYYESGVKIAYTTPDEKLYLAALALNGWQHIQRVPGCQTPAGGTQLTYRPNSKVLLNWSTFAGNEFPDSVQKWRYFNDLYAQVQLHKKFGLIAGFDIGVQQRSKGSGDYHSWYTPVLIARFSPTEKLNIAARGEYFFDDKQVIISTGTSNGFQTYAYSLNIDYAFNGNFMWRVEGRGMNSVDAIFSEGNHFTNVNYFITTSMAINF